MKDFVNLTPEQIDKRVGELKKKYNLKFVWPVNIPADDDGKEIATAFLKKPPRTLMGACMSFAGDDPIKSDEMLLEGIWLEGDDRIKTDDDMFMCARALLPEMIKFRKGTIEKK